MKLIDRAMKSLATSLNYRQLRQEIISSNVANSETPGYKAKRVDFEEALGRALNVDDQVSLKINNPKHYDIGQGGLKTLKPQIYEDPNGVTREDGNTVDRDAEMAAMAQNRILYDASIQLLNKKLKLMKYAIESDR